MVLPSTLYVPLAAAIVLNKLIRSASVATASAGALRLSPDKHSVSALRVYDMASRLLPEGVVNLACRYFFGALAGVLPHPNELRGQILRWRWLCPRQKESESYC